MPRVVEVRHPGEPYLQYLIGNATAIDSEYVSSIGISWLFKDNGKWVLIPRITENQSLFYNAVFFFRFSLPLGIFLSFRWNSSTVAKSLCQLGIGWKLNGRFTLLLRVQSDDSSKAGVTGANYGQATGFEYGTH